MEWTRKAQVLGGCSAPTQPWKSALPAALHLPTQFPVLSHYWAARLGGELRELKCRFIKTGSCQNATANTFFPNPTGEGWEVTSPFDLPVMAFAREMGPHLAGSQTLSLIFTDRKQFKDKPSPCLDEAWLWCLPHWRGKNQVPKKWQPTSPTATRSTSLMWVCCDLTIIRLALPLLLPTSTLGSPKLPVGWLNSFKRESRE